MKSTKQKKITINLEPVMPERDNAFMSAGFLVGLSMTDRRLAAWDRKMLQKAGQYMRWFAEQMK